jgi:hypothetical protein
MTNNHTLSNQRNLTPSIFIRFIFKYKYMLSFRRFSVLAVLAGVIIILSGCTMFSVTKVSEPAIRNTENIQVRLVDDVLLF